MKKRIIAILLALSIFCFSFHHNSKRSYATGIEIAVLGSICAAAVSIMAFVTTGEYQNVADDFMAAADWVGSGLSYTFTGNNVYDSNGNLVFHEDSEWMTGMSQIANGLQELFNKGELVAVDNNYVIKGNKFHSLIEQANQAIGVMARPKVDFTAGYNCMFLDVDLSKPFALESLPTNPLFFNVIPGQSYAAVYFDDNRLVFSPYYLSFYFRNYDSPKIECKIYYLSSDYQNRNVDFSGLDTSGISFDNFLESYYNNYKRTFTFSSLSSISWFYLFSGSPRNYNYSFTDCFVYENGTVTYTPISEVDVSGMNSGLVTTTGDYGAFLKSIDDYSISTEDVPNLDDLSGVVPDDASLSIPVNPDKDKPIAEQVGVSVPGVGDFTLAELQGDLNLDISVPSTIITKFPFCIPFDFARFLGILCADPIAPVFRISISTHPDNLEQWASNETIGKYIDPDSPPLFEIDEEIVIDLSHIPLIQAICYTCFIVGFIFLLLHITPKMIQH